MRHCGVRCFSQVNLHATLRCQVFFASQPSRDTAMLALDANQLYCDTAMLALGASQLYCDSAVQADDGGQARVVTAVSLAYRIAISGPAAELPPACWWAMVAGIETKINTSVGGAWLLGLGWLRSSWVFVWLLGASLASAAWVFPLTSLACACFPLCQYRVRHRHA